MHADAIPVTQTQLRGSLAQHAPDFAGLTLTPLPHGGTETRAFRLGPSHLLRLPIRAGATDAFAAETPWIDWLAPHLPLAVPSVVATGHVATTPPLPWTIQRWIEGTDASRAMPDDQGDMVDRLASFIMALRPAPAPETPLTGDSPRGGPLAPQDAAFRAALTIARAKGITGLAPAVAAWENGLAAPTWQGAPVWLHGDLVPGNMILAEDRLVAIIDWSFVTRGDPAYDLIPAWFVFDGPARQRFLDRLGDDPATISRARARVAWQCVVALPYYLDTNPAMVRLARRGLAALDDSVA
jgi:aminoglycoside phosphotransferase (APT) family kinase protein